MRTIRRRQLLERWRGECLPDAQTILDDTNAATDRVGGSAKEAREDNIWAFTCLLLEALRLGRQDDAHLRLIRRYREQLEEQRAAFEQPRRDHRQYLDDLIAADATAYARSRARARR